MQTFIFKYLLGQKGALGKHQPFPPVYHNSTKAWAPASYSTQKYHCIEFQICTVSAHNRSDILCSFFFYTDSVTAAITSKASEFWSMWVCGTESCCFYISLTGQFDMLLSLTPTVILPSFDAVFSDCYHLSAHWLYRYREVTGHRRS